MTIFIKETCLRLPNIFSKAITLLSIVFFYYSLNFYFTNSLITATAGEYTYPDMYSLAVFVV